MNEDFDYDFLLMELDEKMTKAVDGYKINMSRISIGRANPQILNSITIDYYGTPTPLPQLANISVPEPRQLLIKSFESDLTKKIVSAINIASLGVNAVDEGDKARITLPEMTTERRRDLVKSLGQYTEQAKVQVRNARQDGNKAIKASDQSEDTEKTMLDEVQKLTNKFIETIDNITKEKQTELTTI